MAKKKVKGKKSRKKSSKKDSKGKSRKRQNSKSGKESSWININKQIQDKLEKEASEGNVKCYNWKCGHFPFGAFLFLFVGIIWLAKNQGWLSRNFWPFLFVILGLIFLIKHLLIKR